MALNPQADEKKEEEATVNADGEKTKEVEKKDTEKDTEKEVTDEKKPFQKLLFLVRDWQNFDNDFEEGDSNEKFQIVSLDIRFSFLLSIFFV